MRSRIALICAGALIIAPSLVAAKPARFPGFQNRCVWVTYTLSPGYAEAWRGYSFFGFTPHTGLNPQYQVQGTGNYIGPIVNENFYYVSTHLSSWNPSTLVWDVISNVITGSARFKPSDVDSILKQNATEHSAPRPDVSANPSNWCDPSPCQAVQGQHRYDLKLHLESAPPSTGQTCYEDCAQTAEILWTDCLNPDECASSIKYTFTGNSCQGGTPVTGLDESAPSRCNDQLEAKIAECGGSLNVQSFDFESCSGVCVPDACHDKWLAKVAECGGIMAVSTWNAEKCEGTCVSDPLPGLETLPDGVSPQEVETETTKNSDGTSETVKTSTYEINGRVYTEEVTTTYDNQGNVIGTTVKTTEKSGQSTGDPSEEVFVGVPAPSFDTPYSPGEFDIGTRFTTFQNALKSSPLFSFSSGFFNGLPSGGSSVYTFDGGDTFGSHTVDLSSSFGTGLAVLKALLLVCFGFLSIRAIIMKR